MKTLLIVEDDPLMLEIYRKLLKKYILNIEFCSHIHAAISYIASKKVDLILSDHHLPDSNSRTLLQLLSISDQQIPVVIVTSNTEFKPVGSNNSSLIKEVLYKPLGLTDLERIIRSYLG